MQRIAFVTKVSTFLLKHPVAFILSYAIVIRVFILSFYQGYTIVPDSQNYIDLATLLSEFNLNHRGQRTPGYPLLIAIANNKLQIVVWIQCLLGIVTTYFIYDITRLLSKRIPLALLIAFVTTSFLHVLYMELVILTETLTLFNLLFVFWHLIKYRVLEANSSYLNVLILALGCTSLYFVRPMFIYIPLLFAGFYLLKNWNYNFKKTILQSIILCALPLLALYSWSSLNKRNINVFGSSYYLGINLSQNATLFFEKAADEHAIIRDIFVKHRDSLIIHNPKKIQMSVWAAYDELLETTQLSPPELSHALGVIAKELFVQHPWLYLKQVGVSWKDFWFDRLFWKPQQITNSYIRSAFMGIWLYIQQYLSLCVHVLFVVFGIRKIGSFLKGKCRHFDSDLLIVVTVLAGSLAQALITYGSNGRFSFPYFPLIVYFVFINLNNIYRHYVRSH
jgi:hypothetical protein